MAVLLIGSYADSPEALERGDAKVIQFARSPEQCFDVAEILIKQAKHIMDPTSSSGSINRYSPGDLSGARKLHQPKSIADQDAG